MSQHRWFKGNIHTHTNRSAGGDSPPEHVAGWYHRHGYDFLVLTDDDHRTMLEGSPEERAQWPLLIPGEEVKTAFGEAPIHIGAVGIGGPVRPATGKNAAETIRLNVEAVASAGGLAVVNHPNYRWALDDRAIVRAGGAWGMEVFNGHPLTNNHGGAGYPAAEQIWDRVLTAGARVFGVATDDAHHFEGEFGPRRSNPGRGWVVVEATDLTEQALLEAMAGGRFYASTGVTLAELHTGDRELVIEIEPEESLRYSTVFVGDRGREIWVSEGPSARCTLSRLDTYVRATVHASNGERAWTQPIFAPD